MKAVYDTCVYIDFLRSGGHRELFLSRSQIRYLSPIVMMELLAGAAHPEQKRGLERLFLPYSKSRRLIALDGNSYHRAGECLSRLRARRPGIHIGLSHDILIAISTLSIGATLYTSNRKDFIPIQGLIPVKVEYV